MVVWLGLVLVAAIPAGGQEDAVPRPDYEAALKDAGTADNQPRTVPGPSDGCRPDSPCYLPDPNPDSKEGLPVDSYTADVYERPTGVGPAAATVLRAIDIVSHQVGGDGTWFYFRVNLAGPFSTHEGAPPFYGMEIDFDDDPAGEVLVVVGAATLGTAFSPEGLAAYWNRNSNILGKEADLPEGPGGTIDGYEVAAVVDGRNQLEAQPGGASPVLARAAENGTAVEVAVRRALLDASKFNERGEDISGGVNELGLRPLASVAAIDPAAFSFHDRFGRRETGSPYPYLRIPPPDPICPVGDKDLSIEDRTALDSGTPDDTGIANPCYPSSVLSGFDNSFFASTTYDPPDPDEAAQPPRLDDANLPEPAGKSIVVPVLVLVVTGAGAAGYGTMAVRRRRRRGEAALPEPGEQA